MVPGPPSLPSTIISPCDNHLYPISLPPPTHDIGSLYFIVHQVSCGQMFTLAITEDGSQVFGWGEADHCTFGSRDITGDHFQPVVSSQGCISTYLVTCLPPYVPTYVLCHEYWYLLHTCSCWHTWLSLAPLQRLCVETSLLHFSLLMEEYTDLASHYCSKVYICYNKLLPFFPFPNR